MTAMSAPRASTPEPVPPTSPSTVTPLPDRPVRVVIPGTAWTYRAREILRGLGLRWDPTTHAWHGYLSAPQRSALEGGHGVAGRAVVPLESFERPDPKAPAPPSPPSHRVVLGLAPSHRIVHDGSRTCAESRIAIGTEPDPEASIPSAAGRAFSWWDVTSGLPDDSREADERLAERRLRELRGRVKAARAEVGSPAVAIRFMGAHASALAEFCARWGITPEQFVKGVTESQLTTEVRPYPSKSNS